MQKARSIVLLCIMGMILFPWSLVCAEHPLGHDHHEDHDGPSPCELREQYDGEEPMYWPPMDCENIAVQVGAYEVPSPNKMVSPVPLAVVAAVLFDIFLLPEYEDPVHSFPETRSNSSPPLLSSRSLRAPPVV